MSLHVEKLDVRVLTGVTTNSLAGDAIQNSLASSIQNLSDKLSHFSPEQIVSGIRKLTSGVSLESAQAASVSAQAVPIGKSSAQEQGIK